MEKTDLSRRGKFLRGAYVTGEAAVTSWSLHIDLLCFVTSLQDLSPGLL